MNQQSHLHSACRRGAFVVLLGGWLTGLLGFSPLSQAASVTAAAAAAPVVKLMSGGNSYVSQPSSRGGEYVDDAGLHQWTNNDAVISSYVKIAQAGDLTLALRATPTPGSIANVVVRVAGRQYYLRLSPNAGRAFAIATVRVPAGYLRIDLLGGSKNSLAYPDVQGFELSGPAAKDAVFANDGSNFYWSRRGPSVHMGYTAPAETEYFYNELTIPQGEDPIGSYFMANGFGEGYFGIQVLETERRVLFSVWDPETGRTTLVKKGTNVTTNDFGGEGTGGQSYLVYPWRAGTTYPFITRVRPDGKGNSLYSAWFYAVEEQKWRFIATWLRPNTTTWLTGPYSFCENFIDSNGHLGRRMQTGQQWAVSRSGVWTELTQGWYTVDPTGENKQRLDYAGGIDNGRFSLRMGGFFNDTVNANQSFTRPATGRQPNVQLNLLP